MSTISESEIQYWAELLADRCFSSERELRKTIVEICEQRCRQSWSVPEGKITLPGNLRFARAMPVHEVEGEWKVGAPVNEYLSNMTSDFSDGTNGEPSGYPPSGGDMNSSAGLPDYKYVERLKNRREKLKALIQRRDPDGIEKRIGEAEDFEDEYDATLLKDATLGVKLVPNKMGVEEYYDVVADQDRVLGNVFKDANPAKEDSPAFRMMRAEYPWVSVPNFSYNQFGRHQTKEEGAAYVEDIVMNGADTKGHSQDFWNRLQQVKRQLKGDRR